MSTHNISDIRSLVAKLERQCRQTLSEAADLAYRSGHGVLDIEHLLAVFCNANDDDVLRKAVEAGFDVVSARAGLALQLATFTSSQGMPPALSERLVNLLRQSWLGVSLFGAEVSVSLEAMLRTVVSDDILFSCLCHDIPALVSLRSIFIERHATESTGDPEWNDTRSVLAKYTLDLTARAAAGDIDPVIGRDSEIAQVVEILLRRRQNNPILTGEAGVGKTAIVEGLAQRIAAGLVPESLKNVRLCSLDMGLLRAGAGMRGEIETRLKAIIAEVLSAERPIILFIDEAHMIVASASGQGEQSDIANLIKPELARGTLRTIAATTWAEYKRYFEKDAALSRRFQTVRVDEPSSAATENILQGLVPVLQKHHGVYIMQSAIAAAVHLSSRYIQDRQLPDKAISVLDTACARAVAALTGPANEEVSLRQHAALVAARLVALERERVWTSQGEDTILSMQLLLDEIHMRLKTVPCRSTAITADAVVADPSTEALPAIHVDQNDVASVIADWTGIPSQKMLLDQYSVINSLEETLARRVVGQQLATHIICDRIRAYSANLEDPSRPIGVFLLAGPSGVGKTETAHALAEAFFGMGSITVINMSEYQEAHTVSKLKGAPVGYVGFGQGGVLTESIRRRPYGLLLLDEVEKAHPDVLDLFLQVFDKGFMEDAEGVTVDFKNTLVILTSNAGAELLESFGDPAKRSAQERAALTQDLQQELFQHFKPAFLGRTQVVPYFILTQHDLCQIVAMKFNAICVRFDTSYRASLVFDAAVLELVVAHCVSRTMGARWVEHYISENILSRLSTYVLGRLADGKAVEAIQISLLNGRISVDPLPLTTLADATGQPA